MQAPPSGGHSGEQPAAIAASFFDSTTPPPFTNPLGDGLFYWYLEFTNLNPNGSNAFTSSTSCCQMRGPVNYNNGLTHSFTYYDVGTGIAGEIPGANNRVYWEAKLFALTSSISNGVANFYSAPKLVSSAAITQSWVGAIHDSGSVATVSTMFNDPNGYIGKNSLLFLSVARIDTDSTSTAGDKTNHTASVRMLNSQFTWNTV
jgi:hypothetical protein